MRENFPKPMKDIKSCMQKYKHSNRVSMRKIPHSNTIMNEDKGKILGETSVDWVESLLCP